LKKENIISSQNGKIVLVKNKDAPYKFWGETKIICPAGTKPPSRFLILSENSIEYKLSDWIYN
jgi:hypothetical protein